MSPKEMPESLRPIERQAIARSAVGYGPIQLRTVGEWIQVLIQVDGDWHPIIQKHIGDTGQIIDHTEYPLGMVESIFVDGQP